MLITKLHKKAKFSSSFLHSRCVLCATTLCLSDRAYSTVSGSANKCDIYFHAYSRICFGQTGSGEGVNVKSSSFMS
jgi:hypothetical protein